MNFMFSNSPGGFREATRGRGGGTYIGPSIQIFHECRYVCVCESWGVCLCLSVGIQNKKQAPKFQRMHTAKFIKSNLFFTYNYN